MGLYRHHIFCCTNQRADGHKRGCCASKGSEKLRDYFKQRVKELGLAPARVNTSGCLDQCERGPVVVIYPEGVWYTVASTHDIDRIIDEHMVGGSVVTSLQIVADA
ncbi:MAG: (2Fe-2S) ferredoxin domain-containing protein [Alphaproteobacteria bacterium]|nr:(2Fe-2S) ferredoxin domain-containing protein [Alphaproteobacteria bacterium]